jgi:dTMP kinase
VLEHGFLISFEGGEGSGKSTQIARLAERLITAGYQTVAVREPGGTPIAEQIREVVLSLKNDGMAFSTEVLLFQAARAQIYHEIVLPALKEKKIVLMDRTRDSSVVYQGIVRHFGQRRIEDLNAISTDNTFPNITFLLDIPVEKGLKRRMDSGEKNRLDMEHKDFHQQVRDGYLSLAKEDRSGRWIVINADQTPDAIEKEILQRVEDKISLN